MGGVGVRRAVALTLIAVSFGLIALGLIADVKAALFALTGAALVTVVAAVDVDKLTGRG